MQANEFVRSDAYTDARLALNGLIDDDSLKMVLGKAIDMVDVPIVGTFIGDVWKETLTAYMEKWVDMEPYNKYLSDPESPELNEIEQKIHQGDMARQRDNESRMAAEKDADLVEMRRLFPMQNVEEKSTLIGGPEVEAEIAEMQKLLDEQQQARDELADNIETMKQTFREAHEDDSQEQRIAHEKQLQAAGELAQQALVDEQEAERQALQARQVERQAQQLDRETAERAREAAERAARDAAEALER